MQLSVIIVSYNVKYFLEQCLHSVLAACKNIQTEIIVIDNASADDSMHYLQLKFSQVCFIKNVKNEGFAKANNKALTGAKGEYILFLNPDTIISKNAINNCIAFFDEHSEAGAIGVKMIDGSGNFLPESKRSFPSVMAAFYKLSGIAALFPRSSIFNKYALGNLDENKTHAVDVLAGAYFFSRKEILLALNGFDEDFFMYGEDIDLSFRIQKSGYKNYYLGNNVIIHFKGESTKRNKAYVKNFYGAMKIFVSKHYKNTSPFLSKAAINIGSSLSFITNKTKLFFTSVKTENAKKFVLVGDKEAIQTAAAILSTNTFVYKIHSGGWSSLGSELFTQAIKPNLVFCLDTLNYSDCIQFIQNNMNKFVYYWHYKGSESIVAASNISAIPQIYIAI